jgi:hypothetical protein
VTNPVEDLSFREVLTFLLGLNDFGMHVASLAVGHDNAQFAMLISEGVLEANDIGMSEFLQQFELILNIFPFLLL